MKKVMSAVTSVVLILGMAFVCCSCSRKPNPEGLAELQKMSSVVQDSGIVVSAGVTMDQYSENAHRCVWLKAATLMTDVTKRLRSLRSQINRRVRVKFVST